jgi:signal transduction histidine kinase
MTHEPLRLQPVRLAPLLRGIASTLALPDGVAVRVRCGAQASVLANPELLEQALLTVAENAAKYAASGEIALTARSLARNGTVRIEIRDTGPGMSADERERAVQRFYRGADDSGDGFGLGLAIAAEALSALDGELEIASEPGAGTSVAMTLKRA